MRAMEMARAARTIVETCAAVKPGERVCVVTDTAKVGIAEAIAAAAHAAGADPVLVVMRQAEMHGNEPPKVVAAAMAAADVIFTPVTYAITHTDAMVGALRAGARAIVLRGVTEDILVRGGIAADYGEVRRITERLGGILGRASEARVTSTHGTDLAFGLRGRPVFLLYGMAHRPGVFAAMPDGEAAICPAEGTAAGTLVFDHGMDGIGLLDEPIRMGVEGGRITGIDGGKGAERLREMMERADPGATNIAEFALGTNPRSRLIGNMAEDKKLLGTAHFGVGDSHALGGAVVSQLHLDGMILRPSVWLDGEQIIDEGKVLVL